MKLLFFTCPVLALSLFLPTALLKASPPPPPPDYVWDAGIVLTDTALKDNNKIAKYFADDVLTSVNGQFVANGKAAWLKWWSESRLRYYSLLIGYSEGWQNSGTILIFDQYDTVAHAATPPPAGDPRFSTRSTLYQFGSDHLIHSVQIADVNSFMIVPTK